ncbi:ogr/Delta-like zinc finger family protein [Marilutibacter chinensis]|uniref:ogr/Delta-like zinc finger family protein n=1 Tax=Marilutibacter chinensis TaxID=2912247 RepID=UPI0031BBA3A5
MRSSRVLTPVYREVTYACRNFHCGHVFVCNLEAVRTLSPSAIPDPEVQLPLSSHVRRDMLAHQLQHHVEAAYEPA